MKTGEIAALLGVSDRTIRNWVDRFSDYLSSDAKRVGSLQSAFTDNDVMVLATIKQLSGEGFSYDTIQDRLQQGYRVENPGEAHFHIDRRVVPAAAVEQIIDSTEIKIELAQVRAERDKLLAIVEQQHEKEEELRQEIKGLQERINDLMLRVGKAEGRLEEIDRSHNRDRGNG